MNICFLCNEYPPGPHGGIGTLTQVLARALSGADHRVRVIGAYPADYPAPDYEEDEGVRVWRYRFADPVGRLSLARARYQIFRAVSEWVRGGEVSLVEVPDYKGWAAGWPQLPAPVVVRLSGTASYFSAELGEPVYPITFWLERASLRRADFWCAESNYLAEKTKRLFGLRRGPHGVLYNPVEVPAEPPAPARKEKKVVFAGTLTAKKGIISVVRAWPRVLEACGDARLHVFGKDSLTTDGRSMKALLESQLADGVRASVHFHEQVPLGQFQEVLQSARVAVLPSYAEGFALTPLHAMACACPTIYTRRGSGPEVIRDGRDGLLVDPDRPEEIARAVAHVLTDDELARRLGQSGRERVRQRFSVPTMLSQNEEFYGRCLEAFRGAAPRAV